MASYIPTFGGEHHKLDTVDAEGPAPAGNREKYETQ